MRLVLYCFLPTLDSCYSLTVLHPINLIRRKVCILNEVGSPIDGES